jgi:hypothetical protein
VEDQDVYVLSVRNDSWIGFGLYGKGWGGGGGG